MSVLGYEYALLQPKVRVLAYENRPAEPKVRVLGYENRLGEPKVRVLGYETIRSWTCGDNLEPQDLFLASIAIF